MPGRAQRLVVVTAAAAAGTVAGVVDGTMALLRGADAPAFVFVAAGLLGVVFFVPGWLAIAAASWGWPAWKPPDRSKLVSELVAAAWGLALLGLVVFMGMRRVFEVTDAAFVGRRLVPVALLAALAGLGTWRGLARVLGGPRRRPTMAAVVLGILVAASIPSVSAIVAEIDVRFVIVLASWGAALVVGVLLLPRARVPAVVGLLLTVAFISIVGTGWLVAAPGMRLVAARYAPLSGTAMRWLGRAADLDGDGYSPLSGEGDCDSFDAAIHPFAVDIPGNGVDEDCHGGDLDPAAIAVGPSPLRPPEDRDRPNVLLLTIETLRADRIGLYGAPRPTTPRIDEWFGDGTVFERAYATSPVTDRCLPSLFGGLYPSMYTEALEYREHQLAERRVLLAERLKDAGYDTAGFVTYYAVSAHNLHQGLDIIEHRLGSDEQHARPLTNRVLQHLRQHRRKGDGRPFFVWVHYYDPHSTYQPPDEHRLWGEDPIDRYDGEIHYVDAEIGRLLDALRTYRILDDTAVILTGDHGEEFLDHGATGHAKQLYDESVRVPLLLRWPGARAHRVREPVSLADIMPTVLDLLQIPVPGGLEGKSQAAAVLRGEANSRPIILEQFRHGSSEVEKLGVVEGRFKLILDRLHQTWELYDLEADPGERNNVLGQDPAVTIRLRGILLDYWERVAAARFMDPAEGAF